MPLFVRRHPLALLPLILCVMLPLNAPAQGESAPATATPTPAEHTSTLAGKFVAVPGTPVLFAVHEVRVADWQAFLQESKYQWNYQPHFAQSPDHPVVGITLQDARAFCAWLTEKERHDGHLNAAQSYRLPSPEEWDAAVGLLAGRRENISVEEKLLDEQVFPWGRAWPPPPGVGNFAEQEIPGYDDGFPFTAPVGHFKASPEGLHDLAGNVWEWCWTPEVRAEQTAVLRGASWAYFRRECLTSAYRYRVPADLRMPTIGFRCVFEDRQRTATILAAAAAKDAKERAMRREEILGGDVDKAAMEAVRQRLAGGGLSGGIPDPATLVPAAAGKHFQNMLGMEFVPIGEGNVLMGQTEVRVQDFEAWLKETGRTWDKKPPFLLGASHPAAGLSWEDAQAFCEWLTAKDHAHKLLPSDSRYRLPTDVEWSLAAGLKEEVGADPAARDRTDQSHYPWSDGGTFPPLAMSVNLDASRLTGYTDSYSYTAPVTAEAANENGIIGLGGNVSEWCSDSWPGSEPAEKVIRGGSWLSFDKTALLTSARQHAAPTATRPDLGFRCVLDLGSP